jgi:predicted nucleic acid-binding protein
MVVFQDGSEQALDLLGRDLAAPTIWPAEASNALRTKCARGEISEDEASEFALDLADAPVAPPDLENLLSVAMRMALDLRHATYDCFYLAAALRKDTKLVTADRRLLVKAAAHPYLAGLAIMLGRMSGSARGAMSRLAQLLFSGVSFAFHQ